LACPTRATRTASGKNQLREEVLGGLSERSGVPIVNLYDFRQQCLESHDCLDSLVAAVAAALWARGPAGFRRPGDTPDGPPTDRRRKASPAAMAMPELEAARLEGWIYAPYPIHI